MIPPFKSFLESRAILETTITLSLMHVFPYYTNKGDNDPIMVIPGFGFGSDSTKILRAILIKCGYDARDWGLGRNYGPTIHTESILLDNIFRFHAETGKKVTLIGWSLGGLYARVIANKKEDIISKIITLGSPHKIDLQTLDIKEFFNRFSPINTKPLSKSDIELMRKTPNVPTYCLYTKTDGVVNWQDCINDPAPHVKNIEIQGSHSGLSHNYQAIIHILDILDKKKEVSK